jgi:hypothetical protein
MRSFFKIATLSLVMCVASFAQDLSLIKADPSGRLMLVRDEGDHWDTPISVYSDGDLELFVSNMLTLGGVFWDGSEFKKDGKYSTYLYTSYKNDHDCRLHRIPDGHSNDPKWLEACAELRYQRRLIVVDTRKKTVTVQQVILMQGDGNPHPELMSSPKVTVPLDASTNRPLFIAVNRITAMINREINRSSGP